MISIKGVMRMAVVAAMVLVAAGPALANINKADPANGNPTTEFPGVGRFGDAGGFTTSATTIFDGRHILVARPGGVDHGRDVHVGIIAEVERLVKRAAVCRVALPQGRGESWNLVRRERRHRTGGWKQSDSRTASDLTGTCS